MKNILFLFSTFLSKKKNQVTIKGVRGCGKHFIFIFYKFYFFQKESQDLLTN